VELLKKLLHITLTDTQWSEIGDKTAGMSGNDLSVLSQEMMYIPLRELRQTSFWHRSADGTNTPYQLSSPEVSVYIDLKTLPRDVVAADLNELAPNTVRPRCLHWTDVEEALESDRHRTVTDAQLTKFDEFTKLYGMTG